MMQLIQGYSGFQIGFRDRMLTRNSNIKFINHYKFSINLSGKKYNYFSGDVANLVVFLTSEILYLSGTVVNRKV